MFARIDDWRDMSAQRFIDSAMQMGAFTGAVQARQYAEQQETEQQTVNYTSPAPGKGASPGMGGQRTVPSDAATLATDPGLGGAFDVKG